MDGTESEKDPRPTADVSYYRLCYDDALEWKDHTLVIRVTSKDKEPFFFDTMDYWHGINETRTNRRSIVRIDDEEFTFSPGDWSNRGTGLYKVTNVKGGSLKFPFDGKHPVFVLPSTLSFHHTEQPLATIRCLCLMVRGCRIRDESTSIIRYLVCRWQSPNRIPAPRPN